MGEIICNFTRVSYIVFKPSVDIGYPQNVVGWALQIISTRDLSTVLYRFCKVYLSVWHILQEARFANEHLLKNL